MPIQIVSGRFARRRLIVPKGDHIRPSTSQLRAALCNILATQYPDQLKGRVLDLFAGSGAMGFEILSWGATHIDFVEAHPLSLAALRQNQTALEAQKETKVHADDVFRFLSHLRPNIKPYSVVFADPPYIVTSKKKDNLLEESKDEKTPLQKLLTFFDAAPYLLEPNGILIFEQAGRDKALLLAKNWHCVDKRTYGDSLLLFWERSS